MNYLHAKTVVSVPPPLLSLKMAAIEAATLVAVAVVLVRLFA